VIDSLSTGSSQDYNIGSLTIPANSYDGSLSITFGNFDNLEDMVTKKLVLVLDLPAETAVVGSETTTISYVKYLICNDLLLVINTDFYAEETTWEITDDSGTVVESDGPFDNGVATYKWDFTLADGCYTFTIFDAFGDGLFDGSITGNYVLSCSILLHASGSGNFGGLESTDFCVNP